MVGMRVSGSWDTYSHIVATNMFGRMSLDTNNNININNNNENKNGLSTKKYLWISNCLWKEKKNKDENCLWTEKPISS